MSNNDDVMAQVAKARERILHALSDEGMAAAEAKLGIVHSDGVPWHDAPKPRRWHRCSVQTSGLLHGRQVERCACGATRLDGALGHWFERNSRKRP